MSGASRGASQRRPARLLPPEDARDGALGFVVAVLSFLACLAVIAALAAERGASGWTGELRGSATVVVRPKADETAAAAAARAAETLASVRGVAEADALEKEKAEALLEPWLGKDALPDDVAIPRLVTVDLDSRAPASAAAMQKALTGAGVDATVDDHSLWLKDVLRAARLAEGAAATIAILIAAAAAAVIAFATRAGMEVRGDLIEVLRLSGAEDRFVAGLFQARFARLAALAGLIGAGGAAIIAALGLALGRGGPTPVLPLAWIDVLALAPCPLIAGAIAAAAARWTALSMIRKRE